MEFIASAAAAVAAPAAFAEGGDEASLITPAENALLDKWQAETDLATSELYGKYWRDGDTRSLASLEKLEAGFDKVLREARETTVAGDRPAIWSVYNMGYIVKTRQSMFSIDLVHRRAAEFAPLLDFALITHNHDDHYTEWFKFAMDRVQHKPVVNNFFDNYGVSDRRLGGYTRAKSKTFQFADVTVTTGLCDHNSYLVDYTTPFEVHIGDFTLFHSGDCCSHEKLHTSRQPDMWVFHPLCIMDVAKGCREAIHPKLAVIAHLQELGHAKGRYRWTYCDGLRQKSKIEAAGFAARMPLWGERLA